MHLNKDRDLEISKMQTCLEELSEDLITLITDMMNLKKDIEILKEKVK